MQFCHGLSRARPYLSLAAFNITGKLLKLSDNVFDQFIGARIISIVQQYFKVTITNQFEPKILNLIQFVLKFWSLSVKTSTSRHHGNHIIKVGMSDVIKIPSIYLKTRVYPFSRNFFSLFSDIGDIFIIFHAT